MGNYSPTRFSFFLVRIVRFLAGLSFFGLLFFPSTAFLQTTDEKRAALENELSGINLEIAGLSNTITGLKSEGASLDRDIKLLNATINRANLNIKAKNLEIAKLGDSIVEKTQTVQRLSVRLQHERDSLMQLIRKTNEIDQSSFTEVLLAHQDLSNFFMDLDSFDAIRAGLKNSSDALRSAKSDTEAAQQALEERQGQEQDARATLEQNKHIVESNEKEKQKLLLITKNKQKEYGKVLDDRKKRAAEISAALFALRDSGSIPFGRALQYANTVSAKTGIRPAFLLGIFMQESGFGKNQGSCYVKDKITGAGVGAKSGTAFARVMNPTRDIPPFIDIATKVGRDPWNTLVSCPQEVGWGGAMGAAQFIPSTWVLYANRIAKALGLDTADPWNARDAFMAAGMYLTDIGARPDSYSAERDAACKYFSGKRCSQSSWAATYGNQVMQKASTIQTTMIDPLQNT